MTVTLGAREAQRLLTLANYYRGPIDGQAGPDLLRAIEIVERNGAYNWRGWADDRRRIAAGQAILNAMGHEAGTVDGRMGPNTREALIAAFPDLIGAETAAVERAPRADAPNERSQQDYPRQRDMMAFYGPAGFPACTAGEARLPFPFVIAWDRNRRIRSFRCHALLAEPMTALFAEAARHYGEERYRALGLDLFGGCYNFRRMRGGTSLSTHAWGAAVDLDPDRNQLRWGRDRAAFARPDYEPFWKIVEAHGATSLGRAADRDWMHFQWARL